MLCRFAHSGVCSTLSKASSSSSNRTRTLISCTLFGKCGAYRALFKITCALYGYTRTTTCLWKEAFREVDAYHVLSEAQGSAIPVFLGAINLAKIYFLHGAGEVSHMLLMAWGGGDYNLRPENISWNPELGRALIIGFQRSTLDH
ncbi:hypothetical protein BDV10DRAFT_192292 [Aspergillus recurvatus]